MLDCSVRTILPLKEMVGSFRRRLRSAYETRATPYVPFRLRLETLMRSDRGTLRFGARRTITLQFCQWNDLPAKAGRPFPWMTWRSAIPKGRQRLDGTSSPSKDDSGSGWNLPPSEFARRTASATMPPTPPNHPRKDGPAHHRVGLLHLRRQRATFTGPKGPTRGRLPIPYLADFGRYPPAKE